MTGRQHLPDAPAQRVRARAGFLLDAAAKGLRDAARHLIQPVDATPDDVIPRRAVPQARHEHDNHLVDVLAHRPLAVAAQRNV